MISTVRNLMCSKSVRTVIAVLTYGCIALSALTSSDARAADQAPLIAVAANMTRTIEEIAGAFRDHTGTRVRISFGSSGNLTRQILQGAPFELFLSADEAFPRRLSAADRTIDDGAIYAIGQLALYLSPATGIAADQPLDAQLSMLATQTGPVAIANPDTAPYGFAAREVLVQRGLWEAISPRLVIAENLAQAVQFVASKSAAAGFISASYAPMAVASAGGHFQILPPAWHSPLRQRMVLLKGASPATRAFYDFVLSARGRAVIARYGYTLPALSDAVDS